MWSARLHLPSTIDIENKDRLEVGIQTTPLVVGQPDDSHVWHGYEGFDEWLVWPTNEDTSVRSTEMLCLLPVRAVEWILLGRRLVSSVYEDVSVSDQQNDTDVYLSWPSIPIGSPICCSFKRPTGPRDTMAYRLAIRFAASGETCWWNSINQSLVETGCKAEWTIETVHVKRQR